MDAQSLPASARRGTATSVGVAVTVLAVAAMAVDHLMGDDPGLEDPLTFTLSAVLSIALALYLFGRLVPRTLAHPAAPAQAASHGLWCSVGSIVAVPLTMWLGLPFVLAGAGVVLGLRGRRSDQRGQGTVAVVVGLAVLLFGTVGYTVQAVGKLS